MINYANLKKLQEFADYKIGLPDDDTTKPKEHCPSSQYCTSLQLSL